MKPLGDFVLVEVVDEQGVLITVNNNYGIVKVLEKSSTRPSMEGRDRDIWDSLPQVGGSCRVLTNMVKDYVVGDKKYHFTILSEIVAVL